jgi:hypothetical protein
MVIPCNEEQHGQATRKPCNRARSGLTRLVNINEGDKAYIHMAFRGLTSGQLRNPG